MLNSTLEKTKGNKKNLFSDSNKKSNTQNRGKKATKIVFILIISFFTVLIYINRHKLAPDQILNAIEDDFSSIGKGPGFPCNIIGNEVKNKNFQMLDNDLAFVSDTSFICLNKSAKEITNRQHSFLNPILKVNGNKALIYNLHGTGIKIESKSKNIYNKPTDRNILAAGIAQSGIFGTVTETNGYFGELNIFSKNGQKNYYKYFFADHYINDIALSENGMSASTVGFTSEKGGIVSSLYVFDYSKEEPKLKLDYPGTMLFEVNYISNGKIVAIGDNLISFVNLLTGSKKDYSYEGKNLAAFDVNKKEGVFLALSSSESGTDCELVFLNKKGEVEGSPIKTQQKVFSLSYQFGQLAALSYGKVTVYNHSGETLKTFEVKSDSRAITLFSSNGLYSLGLTEINKIYF